jgi:hypothetical protein
MNDEQLTIRAATPSDAATVRDLAELDSAPPLTGHVLLAELNGAPVAAISLQAGTVAADPFQPSAGAARVLQLRRYQLMRQGADVAPARSLLRRLVPSPAR